MKKTERFYFYSGVEKSVTRYTGDITPLRISTVIALQIQGWKWRFGSFICNYNISKYQEKEKYMLWLCIHTSQSLITTPEQPCQGKKLIAHALQ